MFAVEKIGKFAFFYLIAYALWRFIFQHTVLNSSIAIYFSFVLLVVLFSLIYFCSNVNSGTLPDVCALAWIPFLFYIAGRFLLEGRIEHCSYWILFLTVICLPKTYVIYNKIPYKFMLYSGVFIALSVFFQLFFPSVFDVVYSSFFVDTKKDIWVDWQYGFVGFTYQLAMTAEILVIAECTLFFFWLKNKTLNRNLFVLVAILIIVAVFLTGKRMNSAISLLIPFVFILIKKKMDLKQILYVVVFFVLSALAIFYFFANVNSLVDSPVFHRLSKSLIDYQSGVSVVSGRDYLRNIALNMFGDNPFWGIGPGRFAVLSGTGTDVHNMYIQILCELGLVGMFLFVIPVFVCLVNTVFLLKENICGKMFPFLTLSLLLQLNFLIEGMTENTMVNLCCYISYAVSIALMIECKLNAVNKSSELFHI